MSAQSTDWNTSSESFFKQDILRQCAIVFIIFCFIYSSAEYILKLCLLIIKGACYTLCLLVILIWLFGLYGIIGETLAAYKAFPHEPLPASAHTDDITFRANESHAMFVMKDAKTQTVKQVVRSQDDVTWRVVGQHDVSWDYKTSQLFILNNGSILYTWMSAGIFFSNEYLTISEGHNEYSRRLDANMGHLVGVIRNDSLIVFQDVSQKRFNVYNLNNLSHVTWFATELAFAGNALNLCERPHFGDVVILGERNISVFDSTSFKVVGVRNNPYGQLGDSVSCNQDHFYVYNHTGSLAGFDLGFIFILTYTGDVIGTITLQHSNTFLINQNPKHYDIKHQVLSACDIYAAHGDILVTLAGEEGFVEQIGRFRLDNCLLNPFFNLAKLYKCVV